MRINKIFKTGLLMTLLVFITAFAQIFVNAAEMESIKINNMTLNFNKIVYIDAANGNDSTGDGSNAKPFSGIKKAMDFLCDSGHKTDVAIVMKDGDYGWEEISTGYSYNMNGKYSGMNLSFIADHLGKSYIHGNNGIETGVIETGSSNRIKLTFYGIIFHDSKSDYTHLAMDDSGNTYYNCVFNVSNLGGWNGIVSKACANVVNCLFKDCKYSKDNAYPLSGTAVNCVSTNTVMDPSAGTKTTCLTNVTTDESYHITSTGWENAGSGTNPDGSAANMGVYGGEFTWEYTNSNSLPTLTVKASSNKVKIGNEFTTTVAIHNVSNIYAEDIRITYDTNLFEYEGAKAKDGIKIYKEDTSTPGVIRLIIAHLGELNAANGDKDLLDLGFKAKAKGTGKVDIIKGRIADNVSLEEDVSDENCGEDTITVEGGDVNYSGTYTLLDLGIDAGYYDKNASDTDSTKFDADQVVNGKIDDDDLTEITKDILVNTEYIPNSYQ